MAQLVSMHGIDQRAGALWPVAERFSREWLASQALSGGTSQKLRALCAALERFLDRDDLDPATEHGFVEGAGAMLGVVLVEHFGSAQHVMKLGKHRVKLGSYGFFDPFAAIELALDSDDPRATLAREVALAEAEAKDQGPISRVVTSLSEQLRTARPDWHIADHFDLDVSLVGPDGAERVELDLRRAVETTREQAPRAVEQVVSRLISMLPGASSPELSFDEARSRLVPRLNRVDAVHELSAAGRTMLWSMPIVHDLVLTLQVELEGRARYVRERELRAWNLSDADARALALENLADRSARFRLVRTDTEHGPLLVARTGDGRDSARVLLPSVWAALRERLGASPCIGVPHRDSFFACAADNEPLVRELASRTSHDAARAPHKLSDAIYRIAGHALVVLR